MGIWNLYIHTTPNNKYYVGITSQNPTERWKRGKGYGNNKHFTNAVKKYGWLNIKSEVVAENLTKKQAMDYEKLLIKTLQSNLQEFGYNKSKGGEGRSGVVVSKETKKLISKSVSKLWENEEYRDHMSVALKERFKDEDYLKYHSDIRKGQQMNEDNPNSKKVICITTGKIFPSASEGARFYGTEYKNILAICNGVKGRYHAGVFEGMKLKWGFVDGY